ncbi:peptidoglycan L-alanyl-D-glutamate endopeptidase CwlK [Aquimarina spongiae]|uniref:Peptidoglycan L-alanyl-D-glutamate endopeptidase CwlK n=2 Tax=Aquimarina spongiae TaxID=570521 RepID=A0A1M6JFD4_9FLAO|nr:peptidoglycan L-alanyl-D-glutamate endopeptidase CwlK [Aquimarina spongiae]
MGGITIAGLALLLRNQFQGPVWDPVSEERIKKLHPAVQAKARKFLNLAAKEGIYLRVTDGIRTFAEQEAIYAQGRTKPGEIVTDARGGQSYHNYGLAIDVVPMVNGQPNYDDDYIRISQIGKSLGFTWGGHFRRTDKPHFHLSFGFRIAELQNKVSKNELTNGFVNV